MIASFGLPIATMAAVILGGINFFQNTVQEDVLRERKELLDDLRRDVDALVIQNTVQKDGLSEHKGLLDGLRRDLDALVIPESFDPTSLTGNKHVNLWLNLN